jgi:DNA polymerase I-like protein with 3'-5' exonuclease and polymerase domains
MRYLFLIPEKMPQRNDYIVVSREDASSFVVDWEIASGREIHIDFETTGLDWHVRGNNFDIVSVAIVSSTAAFYVDTRDLSTYDWDLFLRKLSTTNIFAFNVCFDGGSLYRKAEDVGFGGQKILPALAGCTLTLFRALANEGYFGQTHSLEVAQETLLLWENINKNWLKEALTRHGLKKGEMAKLQDLEPEAFAYYNVMDSEASYQLNAFFIRNLVRTELMHRYKFHVNEEMIQIRELIEQQWYGIKIDQPKLLAYMEKLKKELVETEHKFRTHRLTKEYIDNWEKNAAEELYAPHVSVKRVFAKKSDAPWEKPEEWIVHPIEEGAAGKRAAWEKQLGCRFYKETTVVSPRNAGKPAPKFNMQSNAAMAELIYGHLFHYEVDNRKRTVTIYAEGRAIELFLTKQGGLPVGKEMYQVIGELGQVISTYARKEKELGYAETLLAKSSHDGRAHPQFKPHGTMTGRLSASGGLNLQQYPKTADCLGCFVADEGHVIVDCDAKALEPTIQAEFSQDPALRELYLADKPHDIYLWWAQHIHPTPSVRTELQRDYPKAWREGKMEELKKKYKEARNLIKIPVLSFSYSMGAKKLYANWRRQGYKITFDDAVGVFDTYWEKLAVYKAWGDELRNEVITRGGWMLNGFGFPMCIPEERMKDATNTFVQSTGHAVLMVYNKHVKRLLELNEVRTHIPIIQDFHDERICQVHESEADVMQWILAEAWNKVNEELGGTITFSGVPAVGRSIWDVKGG